ncbi:hypothetical protein [Streptomyces shenzhenensis]|uniref:hypothetical protein n=1 Tax=Streptomyces shenzhenensis TaxID=943815 RepID=UPI001F3CECF0|nr:hypothetical protein [Streptomyces shenzhenensis]
MGLAELESSGEDHFNGAVTMALTDPTRSIAGRASLDDVIAELSRHRPVFHSEADLQHSFARVLWELAPDVHSRLEVPQRGPGKTEYLDLQCLGPEGRTAIEFKYFTRGWTGKAGTPVEDYALKAHGATDLARLHFVRDIARLERFCSRPDQNGLALMLSNETSLWAPPAPGRRRTRDHDFRIHHGRGLAGTLLWAEGTYEPNTCSLRGTYPLKWETYSEQSGAGGEFRYLAVFIGSSAGGVDDATSA